MKKIYLSIISFTLFALTSFGQTIIEEEFDYGGSSGALISVTANWQAHSGAGNGSVGYDASSNLTMTGYSETGVGGVATILNSGSEDISMPLNSTVTSGTIYVSSLVNITANASTTGDYFFHMKDAGFGYTVRTYVKDDGAGNLVFGVRETATGTITYGSSSFAYNTTYLMVMKYDFTGDEASVYVLDAATTTEPGTPEVSDAMGTAPADVQMISFRQGSGTPDATFDVIKVATTWADLFPAVPSTFVVTSSSIDATCNGMADGSASITVTGGTSPYTYMWDGGSTTNMQDGLSAGIQTLMVTITDATTVTETAMVDVTISEPSAITISETVNAASCGASNGSITVTATGGSGTYSTYVWSNGSTTNIASGLSSGTHMITVADSDNCMGTNSFVMNPSDGPSVSVTVNDVSCNGLSDGSIELAVSGGTTPYAYTWEASSSTTETATGFSMGVTAITVADNVGCSTVLSATVSEPDALTATMAGTDESMSGASDGTLTATVSGGTMPYTYAWTNTNTTSSGSVSGIAAGTYTATITDANGCMATTNAVTVAAGISVTPIYDIQYVASNVPETADASPLEGQTVIVQGVVTAIIEKGSTKGYWLQDDEALWSGIFVFDPTNYLSVTRGDEVRATASVAEYFTSTQLTSVSSFEIVSSGNTMNPVAISTLDSKTEAIEGVLVKVSNANCDTVASGATFGVWTVNDGSGPAEIENDIYSYGQEVLNENYDVTGVGYYSFSNMYIAPRDINDINISCNFSISGTATDVSCNGAMDGSIAITTAGTSNTFTYAWSNSSSNATATGLDEGTYMVTVTDENSCMLTGSYSIAQPSAISISATTTNTTCGANAGSASVTATGGSGTMSSYLWSNGATTASATGLGNGTYTVTVTDSDGCTGTKSVGINSTDGPNITITSTDITCNNADDGTATAAVSGGTTPYTYTWTDVGNSASVSGLAGGTYSLTVSDNTGCDGYGEVTILNPTSITLTVAVTQESADGASDGTATASASGGTGAITYAFSSGSSTSNETGLSEGTYYVTATDANGCSVMEVFEISNTTPIYDIQYVSSNTPGTNDASPLENQSVKVKGIVTALINKGSTVGYWIQDDEALWSGIYVQDTNTPTIGDEVKVTATVDEFYTTTQLVSVTDYSVVSSGNTVNPVSISTGDASNEDIEGVLVKVAGAECTEVASGATFGVWSVDDGSGVAKIENDIYSYGNEVLGTEYCVTGVGYYTFSVMFIAVRDANDVEANCSVGIEELTENTVNIFPNPANDKLSVTSNNVIDLIRLVDIKGTVVAEFTGNNTQNMTLNLNNISKGLYTVQVISDSSVSNSKVIVE